MINLNGGKKKEVLKRARKEMEAGSLSSMKIAVICFTLNGYMLAQKIAGIISESGSEVQVFTKSRYIKEDGNIPVMGFLSGWAGDMFETKDGIIFIGSAGICVRAIAPYIKSKRDDPAVIVFDELGRFGIPILSGHLGGANELAALICERLGATPVLTTATDINGCFSVDVFAKKNQLEISSMDMAKAVSARLLAGEKVGFKSELSADGALPEGLCDDDALPLGIYVGVYTNKSPYRNTLFLTPKILCAGIGCTKNKDASSIQDLFDEILSREGINPAALCGTASIDVKKDEEGIMDFSRKMQVRFKTYTADELKGVPGEFTVSEFVRLITTVDNICERSAVLLSGNGRLICAKTAKDGVTMAFAVKDKEIFFE